MKRVFLIGTAVAALGVAGPATAATFKGVVVSKQRGVMLVAAPSGAVRAIAGSARVGTRVSVSGTRVRAVGRANRAVVRGVVVRRSAGVTFLSAAGRVLVVHSARRLASTSDTTPTTPATTTTPQPGAVVQTNVAIGAQGDLEEQDEQQVGQTGNVQVMATVASVGAGTVTLTVNGQPLTINLPAGLTLPATVVGTQVTLNLAFAGGQVTAGQSGQTNADEGDDSDDNGNGQVGGDAHGHNDHQGGGND